MISNISCENISIKTIHGNEKLKNELLIISGFSASSYEKTYKTLMEYYEIKLNKNNFRCVHFVKFQDDEKISIKNIHTSFFKGGKISDPNLENMLYKHCAEIIAGKLNKDISYVVLGKSAGGGVALYLAQLIDTRIIKLLLFAPGIKYMADDIKNAKINVVGWNTKDDKIRMEDILPILRPMISDDQLIIYSADKNDEIDTRHEINTQFIKEYCM